MLKVQNCAVKTLSCGVLLLNRECELLLGHATGLAHWDIPKGMCNTGESPLLAALRETTEETGLVLRHEELIELGRFGYRPGKDLHPFASLHERVAISALKCSTFFRDKTGRTHPEIDGFAWVPLAQAPDHCAKNMRALLTGPVDLHAMWQRLVNR